MQEQPSAANLALALLEPVPLARAVPPPLLRVSTSPETRVRNSPGGFRQPRVPPRLPPQSTDRAASAASRHVHARYCPPPCRSRPVFEDPVGQIDQQVPKPGGSVEIRTGGQPLHQQTAILRCSGGRPLRHNLPLDAIIARPEAFTPSLRKRMASKCLKSKWRIRAVGLTVNSLETPIRTRQ
jgi:hypothetical protein